MARLLAKVNVTKKLDIVLNVLLKEAEKYLSMTMIHLEMEKVNERRVTDFEIERSWGQN